MPRWLRGSSDDGRAARSARLARHYNVSRGFLRPKALVRALDGVSFTLREGETLAVVGESGCGKSTLARQVTMIERPTSGVLLLDGQDAAQADAATRKRLRPLVQMVFQNPYASLNPRKKVGTLLTEPLAINTTLTADERGDAARAMMAKVGLRPEHFGRYPHMFSGGQRQRIAVARALMLRPRLVVADEPVSALDVSIQAQVLNLLMDLQQELRHRVPVRLAQPAGRPPHRRRGARHVPRQDRRAGPEGDDVRASCTSLHARAAREHAVARSRRAANGACR